MEYFYPYFPYLPRGKNKLIGGERRKGGGGGGCIVPGRLSKVSRLHYDDVLGEVCSDRGWRVSDRIDTYIHMYIHIHIHTYIHTYTYTYVPSELDAVAKDIHTYMHTYTHTYVPSELNAVAKMLHDIYVRHYVLVLWWCSDTFSLVYYEYSTSTVSIVVWVHPAREPKGSDLI